jgi:hypothetical protein
MSSSSAVPGFAGRAVTGGYRRGRHGVFNVTGEPIPFGRLIGQCVAGTDSRAAVLQWVPAARLLAAGADPRMGVPLWVAAPGLSSGSAGRCMTAAAGHVWVSSGAFLAGEPG